MTTMVREAALTERPSGTSFPGLVGVELRRLWWRRLTKVALAAAVLVTGVTVYTAYLATAPESVARAVDMYEQERANFPQMVAECQRAQQEARDAGETEADFGCAQMQPPTLENFGAANPIPAAIFTGMLKTNGLFYAFLAFLVGASFVAAEFSAGSLGNWLTFQPRRLRVGLSKLLAAAGGGLLVAAAGLGVAALGAWMIGIVNRPDSDLTIPLLTDLGEPLSQPVLRYLVLTMGAGIVGAALGFLVRNTGAVVGVVIGYVVVVEGILAQGVMSGRLSPWLPALNIEGFLSRGTTYMVERCTSAGRCEYVNATHTYTSSWVYLVVFGIVMAASALLVFRRRDVS